MPYVRFDKDGQFNGCRILRLESDLLRIELLPDLGGKIYHWIHKPGDRDYLWQHPRIKPAILSPGTNYDDAWAGGWDELFPNGGAGQHQGESYPDHGEYWTRRFEWDVQTSRESIVLHLRAEGSVTPTRMEKWITLKAGSPAVQIKYRLTHLGLHGFDYLWAQHPALAVDSNAQLLIPASKGIIAAGSGGRLGPEPKEFTWPHAPGRDGGTVDLSLVPARTSLPGYEMVYLTELRDGWFAVLDRVDHCGFGLAFDHQLFNTAWVFQTHGGWRGLHTVVVEPCTGYPYDLAEAAASGRCARLEPGQVLETQVTAVVFTGRDRVERIAPDGTIS